MLYSEYVEDLRSWFWKQSYSGLVRDKRQNKALARSLGLRVPRDLDPPADRFVVKPRSGCGGQNVTLVPDASAWLCEELVIDEDGSCPPRTFDWYVIGGVPRFVQVHRGAIGKAFPSGYYRWPGWEPITDMDQRSEWIDSTEPACSAEMAAAAVLMDSQFPEHIHVRVDFFAASDGLVFNELCVTPGLVTSRGRLSPRWDRRLGGWLP